MTQSIRPARETDRSIIQNFIGSHNHLHRHLDWRDTLEWLGREPFWLLEEHDEIQATLACPPEPAEIAWVRLFAVSMFASTDRSWKKLFERSLDYLQYLRPKPQITSLALRDWYEELLKRNGFHYFQDIVVYMFDTEPPSPINLDDEYSLREMRIQDLHEVARIDNLAFEPTWRLSTDDLLYAAKKSTYSTVIEKNGEIIGYQMSTANGMYAHLARLAVRPDMQGRRLGYALLQQLLDHFLIQEPVWGVTLNTQSNNTASINLYTRTGFRETGERFPVYVY